jgi:hypothetical protein
MSSEERIRWWGIAAVAIAAAAVSVQIVGADSGSQITAQEFLEPIKYLASDQLKGRGDGTRELDKAAKYIANRFRKFGLKPGGDKGTYLQHFTLVVGAKLGRNNSLHYQPATKSEKLQVQQSFIPLSFSANSSIDAPLAFAGYGITAPEYHYDDYTHLDVTGKIVIVLRHEPQEDDDKGAFAGKQLTSHAEIANKAINAKNHGAAGLIIVRDVGNHPGEPDDLFRLGDVSGPQEMSIPIVQVRAEAVDQWIKPSGHTLDKLRQAIDKDLSNHSFTLDPSTKVAIKVNIARIRRQVANVVGELPGSDPQMAGQYIVVGAHYDHLGLGAHNSLAPREIGQIHHGADDNASGTAGVLELADALAHSPQKPRRSIVFICFAGEELGLLGSSYYAGHPTYPLKQTIAMLNMDMIGRVAKNKLYVSGTGTSPGFQQLVQDANKPLNFEIAYSNSGYGASDQTSFTVKEIPVLFFFSGLHSDYHKPSDTWDKIDSVAGARVIELVANVVSGLDASNNRPQYVRVAEPVSSGTGGGGGYGAYFGSIPDFGEIEHGVKFSDVRDGSPAAKAGLKGGDILIEFDGKKIENLYDFTYALRSHKPGETVPVKVMRGSEKITRNVTLEVRK